MDSVPLDCVFLLLANTSALNGWRHDVPLSFVSICRQLRLQG